MEDCRRTARVPLVPLVPGPLARAHFNICLTLSHSLGNGREMDFAGLTDDYYYY